MGSVADDIGYYHSPIVGRARSSLVCKEDDVLRVEYVASRPCIHLSANGRLRGDRHLERRNGRVWNETEETEQSVRGVTGVPSGDASSQDAETEKLHVST